MKLKKTHQQYFFQFKNYNDKRNWIIESEQTGQSYKVKK